MKNIYGLIIILVVTLDDLQPNGLSDLSELQEITSLRYMPR